MGSGDARGGLAERFAGGDVRALADCYRQLGPLLRAYLRRVVPTSDIDDIVQVVFIEVWRVRERYDPGRSLEAWVLAIARRRAIDHLRALPRPTVPLDHVGEPGGGDGRDTAERIARTEAVRGALRALPAVQREAIALAYYGDLSQREIAEHLRVPVGTIKARTSRGLRRLEALLHPPAA